MDILIFLHSGFLLALEVPLLLAMPFLLWYRVSDAAHLHHPYGSWRPALSTHCGLALGVCMLAAGWVPEQYTFDAIFSPGGPWDLSFVEFLQTLMQRLGDAPHNLVDVLLNSDPHLNFGLVVMVIATLFAVDIGVTLASGVRGPMLLSFLLDVLMALLAAGLLLHVFYSALWLLNRLNFWAIGVALLLLQEYRYHVFGLFRRRPKPVRVAGNIQHGINTGGNQGT
ncbi:hypothetical protein [Azospirillum griseum]|uniref:Uncharacterized protein n=1 Tax=Azospirillum griseum TaxID=2496639 RepID=A0A3S0K5X1_9PROT|nr:hypothetical protein [Azospirillum griseum]RTR21492.1 hypothetical protein EJ903_08790 [Azospirillum griseum]